VLGGYKCFLVSIGFSYLLICYPPVLIIIFICFIPNILQGYKKNKNSSNVRFQYEQIFANINIHQVSKHFKITKYINIKLQFQKFMGWQPFFPPLSFNSLNLNALCSYPYLGRDLMSYLDIKISIFLTSLNIIWLDLIIWDPRILKMSSWISRILISRGFLHVIFKTIILDV
jgi:hypothetical protein